MSFVRMPYRPSSSKQRTSAVHQEKKKRIRKKPEWNSTVNDLNVYKASPEEIERRKVIHQSQNVEVVKADKLRKKISRARAKERSPNNVAQKMRQLAILREVLYDQSQLQDTLAKSDRALAVVQDLFGDDPKRYRGLPNVTVAPDKSQVALDNTLPNGTTIDNPSKLDTLSESVMNKTALNEFEEGEFQDSDDSSNEELSYKPVLDLDQFRQFLVAEQERGSKEEKDLRVTQSMAERVLIEASKIAQRQHEIDDQGVVEQDGSYLGASPTLSPVTTAINDTQKIKKTKAVFDHKSPEEEKLTADDSVNPGLGDLRKVLDGLEVSIADYEHQTGRQPAAQRLVNNSFSGYTVALVDSVTKLTCYVKESEIRLRAESTLREKLSQDLAHMQGLVDALTSDLIGTQEEYMRLKMEFALYQQGTETEIMAIKEALLQAGIKVVRQKPKSAAPGGDNVNLKPLNPQPMFQEPLLLNSAENLTTQISHNFSMAPSNSIPNKVSQENATIPTAAFQLSPPKQMDSPKPEGGKVHASRQQIQAMMQAVRHEGGLRIQGQQVPQTLQQQQQQLINVQQQQQKQLSQQTQPYHFQIPDGGYSPFQAYVPGQNYGPVARDEITEERQVLSNNNMQSLVAGVPGFNHTTDAISNGIANNMSTHMANHMFANSPLGTMAVTNNELGILQRQIEELNLQHAQAQSKLHNLQNMKIPEQGTSSQGLPVSPSISPIPAASESQSEDTERRQMYATGRQKPAPQSGVAAIGSNNAVAAARGITVSVPRVEHVDWSDNSPSPGNLSEKSASRRSGHSPLPAPNFSPNSRTQVPLTCGQ